MPSLDMLTSENKMEEADGHLILEPSNGLGFQLVGALQRLGRKVLAPEAALSKEEKLSKLPIRFVGSDNPSSFTNNALGAIFICPEDKHELSTNCRISSDRMEALVSELKIFTESNPEAHVIWALPENSTNHDCKTILNVHEKSTILLCPALFGFRDFNLLDELLDELYKSFPTWKVAREKTPFLFSADAASFLISALHRKDLFAKTVALPSVGDDKKILVEAFQKNFHITEKTLRNKIASIRRHTLAANLKPLNENRIKADLNALEIFPTVLHSIERSMQKCARQFQTNPELELHFPPSQAL